MLDKVIFKVSGACNLACTYCYYMSQRPTDARSLMSLKTANLVLTKFAEYLADSEGAPTGTVYWHGGEPFLHKLEFWNGIAARQTELSNAYGVKWENYVTTNGTLLTAAHASFLAEHKWSVAISIDGPRHDHDMHRVRSNGAGSYNETLRGYNHLRKAGIAPTVLSVLQERRGAGQCLFEHFVLLETSKADILLPLFNHRDKNEANTRTELITIEVMEFFKLWCRQRSALRVRIIDGILSKLAQGRPGLCHHEDACDQVVTIEPDGSIHVCDDLVAVREEPTRLDLPRFDSGDVVTFDQIRVTLNSVIAKRALFEKSELCRKCEIFDLCGGGCPATRWDGATYANPSVHCKVYKTLYGTIKRAYAASNHQGV